MTREPLPWPNKGSNIYAPWLIPHVVGERQPNGSFLIKTKVGANAVQARVLVGHHVALHDDTAYTGFPSELLARLDELRGNPPIAPEPVGQKPLRAESDVADLTDDTDDISRRIQEGSQLPREKARPTPAKPPAAPKLPPAAREFSASDPRTKPAKGSMPSIEWVQLDRLLVDDSYQRSIDTSPSRALIARIGREWDWRLCVPLMVSRRADGLYVIDGQHRLFGARQRRDVPQLPCCISVYDGPAAEAAMFVAANRERRAMNRLDDFHAAQAGGDTDALAIAALIESVGFTVSRKTGSATWVPGEVAFTSAIGKVRRKHGDGIVRTALQMMADAFPGERLVAGASIFTALSALMVTPPDGFDQARLKLALKTFDMKGWASFLAGAKGGDDRASKLRQMLLAAYDDVERGVAA